MNNENLDITIFTEITDYHSKIYGLTVRQLIFSALTGAIVIPLYYYGRQEIPENIVEWLVIIVAIPLMTMGFIPIQQMNAEKIVPYLKRHYIDFWQPLEYKNDKDVAREKNEKSSKYMYFEDGTSRKLTKEEKKIRKQELKVINKRKKEEKKLKQAKAKKEKLNKKVEVLPPNEKLSKRELRKQRKQEKQLAKAKKKFQENVEVLPPNEKLSKRELRKQRKQEKQLAKAKKKFQENVEVLPPTTNRDKAKSTDNILIGTTTSGKGRKLFHGIKPKSKQTDKTKEINTDKTVMKKNKEQTVTETVKQNETKENHAKKKFDAYMEFKKQYPDCSKDDFEIYYSMLNEGVDDNEKNKEEN